MKPHKSPNQRPCGLPMRSIWSPPRTPTVRSRHRMKNLPILCLPDWRRKGEKGLTNPKPAPPPKCVLPRDVSVVHARPNRRRGRFNDVYMDENFVEGRAEKSIGGSVRLKTCSRPNVGYVGVTEIDEIDEVFCLFVCDAITSDHTERRFFWGGFKEVAAALSDEIFTENRVWRVLGGCCPWSPWRERG